MANGVTVGVIGSGVVGLTTAVELLRRGARVTVFSRDIDAPPASSAAPALFTPYFGPSPERFQRWTCAAYGRWCELARSDPDAGVTLGTLRECCYAPHRFEAWLAELLKARLLPARPPFAVVAETLRPHIDMLKYLAWLRSRVTALGGALVARAVASVDEVFGWGCGRAVNCAGTGALGLTRDPLLRPMHGQVLHVPNDIGLAYSLHDDAPGGRVAYVFRFADRLVVGGTFEEGRTGAETDERSLGEILERARELLRLDGFERWRDLGRTVLFARAGARPARGRGTTFEDIRLEVESRGADRRIVHHYGHGRMGVTLAWATAADAAEMAMGSG